MSAIPDLHFCTSPFVRCCFRSSRHRGISFEGGGRIRKVLSGSVLIGDPSENLCSVFLRGKNLIMRKGDSLRSCGSIKLFRNNNTSSKLAIIDGLIWERKYKKGEVAVLFPFFLLSLCAMGFPGFFVWCPLMSWFCHPCPAYSSLSISSILSFLTLPHLGRGRIELGRYGFPSQYHSSQNYGGSLWELAGKPLPSPSSDQARRKSIKVR